MEKDEAQKQFELATGLTFPLTTRPSLQGRFRAKSRIFERLGMSALGQKRTFTHLLWIWRRHRYGLTEGYK